MHIPENTQPPTHHQQFQKKTSTKELQRTVKAIFESLEPGLNFFIVQFPSTFAMPQHFNHHQGNALIGKLKPRYQNNASTHEPQYQSNNASTHPPHYQNHNITKSMMTRNFRMGHPIFARHSMTRAMR